MLLLQFQKFSQNNYTQIVKFKVQQLLKKEKLLDSNSGHQNVSAPLTKPVLLEKT